MRLRILVAALLMAAGLSAGMGAPPSALAAPAPGDLPGITTPDSAGFEPPAYTLIGSDDVLPHIRRLHTSVYDPLRQRMIVIGGTNGTPFFNDVWSLPMEGPAIWTQLAVAGTGPAPIASHSAIYDPLRDRIIVFGGYTVSQGRINEVWSLSLSGVPTWSRIVPTGSLPTARNLHTAIYDPVRDRMIVYGGYATDFFLGDAWALDLSGAVPNWTRLAPTPGQGNPGTRRQHAAIYDPIRDRMIISGGMSDAGSPTDAWALSLAGATSWSPIQTQGATPLPNDSHSAVYDPWGDRMIVYGGVSPEVYRDDTWTLALSGPPIWTQLLPAGSLPDGRLLHTAIVDAPRNRMVVFAGHRGVDLADTWALSMVGTPRWTMLSPAPPVPPGPVPVFLQPVTGMQPSIYLGQSLTLTLTVGNEGLSSDDGRIVVSFPGLTAPTDAQWVSSPTIGDAPGFRVSPAGSTIGNCAPGTASYLVAEYVDDAWAGDPAEANTLTLTVQPPAVGTFLIDVRSTMHVSGLGPCALVDGLPPGGTAATDQQSRTVKRFAVNVFAVPAPGTPPPALADHSAILDPVRDRMILFGGDLGTANSFLWAFSFSDPAGWSAIVPIGAIPPARQGHAAIHDPPRDRMVVFGGADAGPFNDVWALGLSGSPAWSLIETQGTPPLARRDHSATYDPVRDRMIVFGGYAFAGFLNDVWALDLAGPPVWSPIIPAGVGPSPRMRHTAIYDPAGDRILVFGGQNNAVLNDSWELSLSGTPTWRQLAPPDPLPTTRHDHAFAFDAARGRGWLIGGFEFPAGTYRNDTWTLSTAGEPVWTQRFAWGDPMPGRARHAMVLDPARDRLVVTGGENSGGRLDDTWFLSLSDPPTWQRLDGPAPPPPPAAPIPVFASTVSAIPATIVLGQTFTLQLSVRNDGAASDDGRIVVSFPAFTDPADAQRVSGSGSGDAPGYMESPAGTPLVDAGCQPVTATCLAAEYRDSDWVPFGNELNGVSLTVQPAQAGTFEFYVRSTLHTAGGAPCALVNGLPLEGEGGFTDQQGFPVRRFTITVQPAPTAPIPVFVVAVGPATSVFIGQAVTVNLEVRNDGAASDDGRIVIGFPALTAAGDEAFVSSPSTGDVPGYREIPVGTALIGADCQPLTASYLTVEYADADWPWLGTETNAFSVTVQPRLPGTFHIDVRSTMHTTGGGACAWENGVPLGGEPGITDLQGFPVHRFTVTVLPSPPDPSVSILVSPSTVVVGQPTRISANVTNAGALSDDGRIVFGFPALAAVGDAVWAGSSSAGDTPGYREYPAGTSLPNAGCQAITASYLTVEYADDQWTGGETNQLAVDVVPQAVGTFTVEVRSTMHVTGGGACDVVSDVPPSGTAGTDQQGFAIRSFSVIVVPIPPPVPTFAGAPTGIPVSIALGENFRIGLALTNSGTPSDDGRISVGFPTLVNLPDAQWVEGTASGDAPGYQERLPGSLLMNATCQPMPAGYLVVEYADGNWAAGESNTLSLMVQPPAAGTFAFEVRGTLRDPTATAPPCAYATALPGGGSLAVDQQGFNVSRFTVEVTAPPAPLPAPSVTWSTMLPPPGGPAGRMNAGAIYHPGRQAMLMYGGSNPVYQPDVWSLSLAGAPAWSLITVGGPVPLRRVMHSMIYNSLDDQVVIFGGLYDDFLNDMTVMALNPQPWWFPNPGSGTPPSPRGGHAAIYDGIRHRMLVIGGFGEGTVKNDVWEYVPPNAGVWRPLTVAGTPMPPRAQHTAVYDPVRDRVVVFGGDGGVFLNDVWALNLAGPPTWEPLTPSGVPPSGRREHTAIYDPVGDRMIVFGGFDGARRGDTWALNLSGSPVWTRLYANAVGPASRSGHVAVYDPPHHRVVMWGGSLGSNEIAQDMWALGLDVPTPVAVSLVSSEVTSDAVRLTWTGEGLANVRAILYRAEGEDQDWTELGSPTIEAGERLVYEDRAVEPGRRYGYRLVVREGDEQTELPAVWVTVPERAVLGLIGASPNPAQGELTVAFSLSDNRTAALELFDLKGRRVASRAVGGLGTGPHRVALSEGQRLPAGVYLVRLTRGADVLQAKAAIVR